MKITDIFEKKSPVVSFEMFPPKTPLGEEDVKSSADKLLGLNPDYMSVTYGAGGAGSNFTIGIASHIEKSKPALAHLTCVGADEDKISATLDALKAGGVSNILALRGDVPAGMNPEDAFSRFKHASDLAAFIKRRGDFCVGGACYPEGHPAAVSRAADIENLKKKTDAGCDFLVTQLFFDNAVFFNFCHRLTAAGVNVPVTAGIMPITNAANVKRMTAMSGAALGLKHRTITEKWADNPAALRKAGIALAVSQIAELIANDVRGIHLYVMNRFDIARDIISGVGEMSG